MKHGWENGSRVPVYEDDHDDDQPKMRIDSPALVMSRRLVGFLLADTHPALGLECLALVTGIGYDGASLNEIGLRHGVTRAAVSARCIDLCDAFGIPPVQAMRSEKSRENCRKARIRDLVES